MDTLLCDISAFEFLRTPPCVLRLGRDAPDLSTAAGRRLLRDVERFFGGVRVPVHILAFSQNELHRTAAFTKHLWSGELPVGSLMDLDSYHKVTSPEMTLLVLARHLNLAQLLLAMYELTGSYTEVHLSDELLQELQAYVDRGWRGEDGWRPVIDRGGKLTDLWMRPPLTTAERLQEFAQRAGGAYGIDRFRRAVSLLMGQSASPFETKAAMLMGLPRSIGGYGIGPLSLNHAIRFDRRAQMLSGRGSARVDIYLEATNTLSELGIECQGRVVHGPGGINEGDADRVLALEHMGLQTVLITYRQIYDERCCHELMRHIVEKRGGRLREKTPLQQKRERELRYELFWGWDKLWR